MTRAFRRAPALAALLACLAVLAACTAGAPPGGTAGAAPSPRDVVAAAVRSLADAGSARVTLSTGAPTGPLTASGPVRFEPFAADLTAVVGTREAQVRAVDGRAWLRLGRSGRWQSVPAGLLPVGAVSGALRAAPGLAGVTGQGTEPVGAVPAAVYRGTVDLAAARAAAPGDAPRIDQLAGLVSPTPRFTAWIGASDAGETDRGRLLRLRLEPAGPPPGAAGPPAPGAVTVAFAEPGLPVEVTAPS